MHEIVKSYLVIRRAKKECSNLEDRFINTLIIQTLRVKIIFALQNNEND